MEGMARDQVLHVECMSTFITIVNVCDNKVMSCLLKVGCNVDSPHDGIEGHNDTFAFSPLHDFVTLHHRVLTTLSHWWLKEPDKSQVVLLVGEESFNAGIPPFNVRMGGPLQHNTREASLTTAVSCCMDLCDVCW